MPVTVAGREPADAEGAGRRGPVAGEGDDARLRDGRPADLQRDRCGLGRRAQGDDREAGRRELIEVAARREVLMMVPVVFLVLPVTVLFAFWPGVVGLSLTMP